MILMCTRPGVYCGRLFLKKVGIDDPSLRTALCGDETASRALWPEHNRPAVDGYAAGGDCRGLSRPPAASRRASEPGPYFKEHLPPFEAEVQYYELRYEAERCRPDDADRTWAAFWLQEMSRMTQQIEAHPELYAYFRTGGTDRDEEYFGGDSVVSEQNAVSWGSFMALARYEQDLETIFTELLNT